MRVEENDNIDTSQHCTLEQINAILAFRQKQGHNIQLMDGHMRNVGSMYLVDALQERGTLSLDESRFCRELHRNRIRNKNALGLDSIAKSMTGTRLDSNTPETSATLFIAVAMFGISQHHARLLDDVTDLMGNARLLSGNHTMQRYSQLIAQLKDAIQIARNNIDRWDVVCNRLGYGTPQVCPKFTNDPAPEMAWGF